MKEERFYDLLSLMLSGEAIKGDLKLLEEAILQNPEWRFLYENLIQSRSTKKEEVKEQAEQAFAALAVRMHLQEKAVSNLIVLQPSPKRHYHFLRMGAAMAIFLLLAGAWVLFGPVQQVKKNFAANETIARKGSRSLLKLPDGTQVWLNAESKISYPEPFTADTREVFLSGEAYFDVAHDAKHPFIIHTGKADIRVLGTAFNVRNYPTDKTIETTLLRGRVEVLMNDESGKKIVLHPLEKLVITKTQLYITDTLNNVLSPAIQETKVNLATVTYNQQDSTIAELSWMEGKLSYTNQPLSIIAEDLARNYDVTINIKKERVAHYRYTGFFDNKTLEEVFQLLQLSKNFNYTIKDKIVTIN